jgi:hypothetical protein
MLTVTYGAGDLVPIGSPGLHGMAEHFPAAELPVTSQAVNMSRHMTSTSTKWISHSSSGVCVSSSIVAQQVLDLDPTSDTVVLRGAHRSQKGNEALQGCDWLSGKTTFCAPELLRPRIAHLVPH